MMRYLCAVILLLTTGCATKYQPAAGSAYGFSETAIADNVYRMRFVATPQSTRETVQTYWLYRATELTLEKGFDGFRILSPIALGQADTSPYAKVRALFIFIPGGGREIILPMVQGDIELIKGPIESNPPKVFDARQLRTALEPWVKAETKCESGNVCPHLKRYLRPAAETPQIKPEVIDSRSLEADI